MAKVKVTILMDDALVKGNRWRCNLTTTQDLMYNIANGVNERNETTAQPHEIFGKATTSVSYELIPD